MQIVLSRKTADQRTVYYTIDDRQRTLFHQYALTLRWGSSISGGRERQLFFESQYEKDVAVKKILKSKLKKYRVLYSYFRDQAYDYQIPIAEDQTLSVNRA